MLVLLPEHLELCFVMFVSDTIGFFSSKYTLGAVHKVV